MGGYIIYPSHKIFFLDVVSNEFRACLVASLPYTKRPYIRPLSKLLPSLMVRDPFIGNFWEEGQPDRAPSIATAAEELND